MTQDLIDTLLVLFIAIPAGAFALLVVGFYLAEAVRKTWRGR